MQLNQHINPTAEQIGELLSYPKDIPVTMVNILRFKSETENIGETGAEAYTRYSKNVIPFLEEVGAKLIWKGNVSNVVIGDVENQPDLILLVEYPSARNFLKMITNPEYQAVANDRTIALEYGGLIACKSELIGKFP